MPGALKCTLMVLAQLLSKRRLSRLSSREVVSRRARSSPDGARIFSSSQQRCRKWARSRHDAQLQAAAWPSAGLPEQATGDTVPIAAAANRLAQLAGRGEMHGIRHFPDP